ncbi:helix-turn-helix domain-containing protein [Microbacterium sp. SS28]|uniref:helix-turn-helix domain-containing protein n=1 Tax=Microbacterium sp. SS28 TaxID=2919948 RepID=UPI001FAADDF8|nr:helix-turn-helix domain-containing protein [Microbacterium sp. SS28]
MPNDPRRQKLAYSVQEAAEVASISVSLIRQLIRDNKLPARRQGSKILILHSDLLLYLESLPEA